MSPKLVYCPSCGVVQFTALENCRLCVRTPGVNDEPGFRSLGPTLRLLEV